MQRLRCSNTFLSFGAYDENMRNYSYSEANVSGGAKPSEGFFVDEATPPVASQKMEPAAKPAVGEFGGDIMTDLIFKLTVNQFCSVIRQHGIDRESEMMLGMLESLVIAGEIALHDFMERVQNLLPHIFAQIDRGLIKKLTETALD